MCRSMLRLDIWEVCPLLPIISLKSNWSLFKFASHGEISHKLIVRKALSDIELNMGHLIAFFDVRS